MLWSPTDRLAFGRSSAQCTALRTIQHQNLSRLTSCVEMCWAVAVPSAPALDTCSIKTWKLPKTADSESTQGWLGALPCLRTFALRKGRRQPRPLTIAFPITPAFHQSRPEFCVSVWFWKRTAKRETNRKHRNRTGTVHLHEPHWTGGKPNRLDCEPQTQTSCKPNRTGTDMIYMKPKPGEPVNFLSHKSKTWFG